MEQEITISENIFNFLSNNLTYGRSIASDCIDVISDNYIIDDNNKTVFRYFSDSIDKIEESKRNYLFDILKKWLEYNRKKLNEVSENDWKNDLIKLCGLSNDKIYLNAEFEEKEIKQNQKKYFEIEFHNSETLIKPDLSNRLKNLPYVNELENNVYYDLNKILFPFIRNAKFIEIRDPYITSTYNYYNFENFTNIIPKSAICSIIILRSSLNNISEYPLIPEFKKLIERLNKEGHNMTTDYFELPKDKDAKHIERYIITNKYEIYLPGGFSCLNKDGYAKVKKKYEG
ncbi:MAG: hypothetical protein NTU73_14265 [Ignavibacteriae bacterium]|nr:hypothetical protein [Ignavibacteriota bacterium]